jgi:MFS superfamily sulfate permease-like transporter
VLTAFGLALIGAGLLYRTPFPVQPMKAAGAIAATQAAAGVAITASAVHVAALVTGVFWLVLGLTGTAKRVAEFVARPIVIGIVLGLGVSLMLEGIRSMAESWWVAAPLLAVTAVLLRSRRIPVMFLMLLFGAGYAIARDPALGDALLAARPAFHALEWSLGAIGAQDLLAGIVFLALPQLPLTLGNAVIAITEENNRLFPDRPVTARRVATTTGLMNVLGAAIGGVPMCHGAGGMAGHVRFGARTGAAPVILGTILLLLALFLSDSIGSVLALFPRPVLGVILFLTGLQLALGSCDFGRAKGDRFVTLGTAAFAVWNVGAALAFGLVVELLLRRGWMRV